MQARNEVISRGGKTYRLESHAELQGYVNEVTAKPAVGDHVVVWLSSRWQVVLLEKANDRQTEFIGDDGSGRKLEIPIGAIVAPFIIPR